MNRAMITFFCATIMMVGATTLVLARPAGGGPQGFPTATLPEPNPDFRAKNACAMLRFSHSDSPPCLQMAHDDRLDVRRDSGDRLDDRMERRGSERADRGGYEGERRSRRREHSIHHGGRNWARDWNDFDRGGRGSWGNGSGARWSQFRGDRDGPGRDYGGGDIDGPSRGLGLPYWAPD
jgi:hypothetical protein